MTNYTIIELTKDAYDRYNNSTEEAKYWLAIVCYQNGVKYFKFDEPYSVKVSDFFDKANKDNSIISIVMA